MAGRVFGLHRMLMSAFKFGAGASVPPNNASRDSFLSSALAGVQAAAGRQDAAQGFPEIRTLSGNQSSRSWANPNSPRNAASSIFGSMDFVQRPGEEQTWRREKCDVVHISLTKKKTFVALTDAAGNKKTGASAGSLGKKGRGRLSRYSAEATAEHVGRSARKMGVKSVVIKVKGSVFMKNKKKVILAWRDGFRGEGVLERSPVAFIQDVTQLPHNGCRLPKRQRK